MDRPPIPHMTADQFRTLGHGLIDWLAHYLETVESRPVSPAVRPGDIAALLPDHPPKEGEDWAAIIADLDRVVMPGLLHWQSPNFFGYFPANGSYPGILGDLVSTGLGVNGMLWATSPAATEIETRVLDWLGEMIGLPQEFLSNSRATDPGPAGSVQASWNGGGGGVIQGTASEATLVALVAARDRVHRSHPDAAGRLILYASTQAHSSVVKAAMIAGLGETTPTGDRRHIRQIEVDERFAMDPARLSAAMQRDAAAGDRPFFVCATIGTTSTTAVDPLPLIGPICLAHNAWLHVDAAMAGAACICPEHCRLLDGVKHADSFSFNPHKWLLTNFDCCAMWTRDRRSVIDALSITPEYLRNAASDAGAVVDYRDWQVPLGRRMRALKLWFVIRHYGVSGLRAYIREHMRIAALFEQWVRADDRFEVVAPRTITLICFRLRPHPGDAIEQTNERNRRLLAAINATGRAYLSHTVLPIGGADAPGSYILRMAIGGARTEERHVRAVWKMIEALP